MWDNGSLVKHLEGANCGMEMETSMMGNGKLTLLMDMVLIFTQMVQNMKECGCMINRRALEMRSGQMEISTKDILKIPRSMGKVNSPGQMAQSIVVTLLRANLRVLELISFLRQESIKANGRITR